MLLYLNQRKKITPLLADGIYKDYSTVVIQS